MAITSTALHARGLLQLLLVVGLSLVVLSQPPDRPAIQDPRPWLKQPLPPVQRFRPSLGVSVQPLVGKERPNTRGLTKQRYKVLKLENGDTRYRYKRHKKVLWVFATQKVEPDKYQPSRCVCAVRMEYRTRTMMFWRMDSDGDRTFLKPHLREILSSIYQYHVNWQPKELFGVGEYPAIGSQTDKALSTAHAMTKRPGWPPATMDILPKEHPDIWHMFQDTQFFVDAAFVAEQTKMKLARITVSRKSSTERWDVVVARFEAKEEGTSEPPAQAPEVPGLMPGLAPMPEGSRDTVLPEHRSEGDEAREVSDLVPYLPPIPKGPRTASRRGDWTYEPGEEESRALKRTRPGRDGHSGQTSDSSTSQCFEC